MQKLATAMNLMRNLPPPRRLRAEVAEEEVPSPAAVNTHIHLPPNFSAFSSIARAVEMAHGAGISLLGAGNYYDFTVYGEFAAECARRGLFPLYGMEIMAGVDTLRDEGVKVNDPGNPGKMYICGKGITCFVSPSGRARSLLAKVRENDSRRIAEMVRRLDGIFAEHGIETGLDADALAARVAERCGCPRDAVTLQERHVAMAFQEALFVRVEPEQRRRRLADILGGPTDVSVTQPVAVQNEIRLRLMKAGMPAFVEEEFVTMDEAVRLILELGGIPCYPTLADGAGDFCGFEEPVEGLIDNITDMGFHFAEFIPVRNDPQVLARYVTAMREAGIVVTAGSEHNTLELRPLGLTARDGQAIPGSVREIFLEGACVAAAHQYLSACGECGYVDGEGRLNPAWSCGEKRIAEFARLGAAVIDRFVNPGGKR